ncbi:uncharacterized protein STEHIDRAFT_113355 [Stereum hirsutum FP-91666 SS1]|uniref:uncharacterized protein n=1 Tax=Stereum hirsutum (strain FP-91666) TaxID=721885 RepID=UPI0004449F64|nr:uncharacterized protein STEHIDRAFT_113355 [Stereum hirsutum FP-91666 SS1]EIM83171.1 hypothetical protein STEHIDRAFT_113355 [Stereum hirsutum FP-91666 SS1]
MIISPQDLFALQLWLVNDYAVLSANDTYPLSDASGAVLWVADLIATLPTEIQTLFTRTCAMLGYIEEMTVIISIATTGSKPKTSASMEVGVIQQKSVSTAGTLYYVLSRCTFVNEDPAWFAACLQLVVPAVAIAFDIFIVTLTLMKCVRHFLEMRTVGQFSLTRLLLRDVWSMTWMLRRSAHVILPNRIMLTIGAVSVGTGILWVVMHVLILFPPLLSRHY